MNYTSIEQSKKLLELGLSPDTADMYWKKSPILNHKEKWIPRIINNLPILFDDDDIIPCWSVGALLEIIRYHQDCNFLDLHTNRASKWRISTSYYDYFWKECNEVSMSLLDASYNLVVFLLKGRMAERSLVNHK